MNCIWDTLIKILPIHLRKPVDKFTQSPVEEIRLRLEQPTQIIANNREYFLDQRITTEDLAFCINTASQYSPWSIQTLPHGYITLEGGHRIGISGNATYKDSAPIGINAVHSLCIRVANEFPLVSKELWQLGGSILIIGKPGSGKTTLLRDLISQKSDNQTGSVCVVDEKRELFPFVNGRPCYRMGKRTDILSGYRKADGISIALKNMGPAIIAMDEITATEDCVALLHAGWCGVHLIASAHAGSRHDLFTRLVYKPIIDSQIFDTLVILDETKSWHVERMYE